MTTLNLIKNKENYFSKERNKIIEIFQSGGGTRKSCFVPRNGDKCKIRSIVFKIPQCFIGKDIDYKTEFSDGNILLEVGGEKLSKIEFNVIISVSKIIRTDKSVIIGIPDYFFNEINLIGLQYHDVRLTTEFNNIQFEVSAIYCEYICVPYIERVLLKLQTNITNFQSIEGYFESVHTKTFRIRMCLDGNIKGYFIQEDIHKFDKICVQFNGHDMINYDENMILSFCEVIDDNLFYVPFNTEKKYNDLSNESYIGSFNHNKLGCVIIVMKIL